MLEKLGNTAKAISPKTESDTLLKRLNPVTHLRNQIEKSKSKAAENKSNALELEKVFVRAELIDLLDKIAEFKSQMNPQLYNEVLVNIPYSLSPVEKVSNVDQTLKLDRNIDSVAKLKLLAKAIYKGSQKVEGYMDNLPEGRVFGGQQILDKATEFDNFIPEVVEELLVEDDCVDKINQILSPKKIEIPNPAIANLPAQSTTQLEINVRIIKIITDMSRIKSQLVRAEIKRLSSYADSIKNQKTKLDLLSKIDLYIQEHLKAGADTANLPGPYEWIIKQTKAGRAE
jgi:hypothetical protein